MDRLQLNNFSCFKKKKSKKEKPFPIINQFNIGKEIKRSRREK